MKELKDLSFGVNDMYAPVIYLLYRKGIISEEELQRYIDSYRGEIRSLSDALGRIENMLG